MPQALNPLFVAFKLGESLFLISWGNKELALPSIKVKKFDKYLDKVGSTGCKWSRLNTPGTETPLFSPFLELGEFPFLIISPLG